MMDFRLLTVNDYETVKPFFAGNPYNLCVYSPASLIAWSYKAFKAYFTVRDGILFIAGDVEDQSKESYLILPMSQNKVFSPADLYRFAKETGFSCYWRIPGDFMETRNNQEFNDLFTIEDQPGYEDYIYRTEDLIYLKGNKYSKKRNLINQFTREYLKKNRVAVNEIRPEDVDDCLEFLEVWCKQHDCDADPESDLACEKHAVITTLKNMARLEWQGIQIRVDGRVCAFGIGTKLNDTTATLNFEKADSDIKGLYQFLDNECAKRLFPDFYYLNKESDMNLPNLAESKQSYHPINRVKSYSLILKDL